MEKQYKLNPGSLSFEDIKNILQNEVKLDLAKWSQDKVNQSREYVNSKIKSGKVIYGINTGFGKLASCSINEKDLSKLQHNLILSHAVGVGNYLAPNIVKLILLLKINNLAQGFSGIRYSVIEKLILWFNNDFMPCIPEKGSVGASGDLAPLAHMSAPLIGYGEVFYKNKKYKSSEALELLKQSPIELAAKEGLALLNGTQVSTCYALYNLINLQKLFETAITNGALTVIAANGNISPFDKLIHEIRKQPEQLEIANKFHDLLKENLNNEIAKKSANNKKVQDPYSLRCQPQILGAVLQQLRHCEKILIQEANGVTDNPLVFSEFDKVLSGGNFHAEPVAFVADIMAMLIAEIGNLAERRVAFLVDNHHSNLPAFLAKDPGINSGFMITHVTMSALASENKALSMPRSVDTIPTSANQEDHVSMATNAGLRLFNMMDNLKDILAIELLTVTQAIDFHKALDSGSELDKIYQKVRSKINFAEEDKFLYEDINIARELI
tara:strand:+ start:21689 stop:23179 length:1491 start_codon:yes stop_codon:yes gene_type:complete